MEERAETVERGERVERVETLRYADAQAELEEIVRQVQAGEIEVDELAAAVTRAGVLIRGCRQRLQHADRAVQAALAAVEEVPEEGQLKKEPAPLPRAAGPPARTGSTGAAGPQSSAPRAR